MRLISNTKKYLLNKTLIFLIIIVFLGFLIRVINIQGNPVALYGDELTIVYDSYSILKTGHDQTGEFMPLTFRMGAGRPAGYVYGSIPFVVIFGPTALGVRSLSLLSGVGIIILAFLIGKKLFSPKIGLITATLISVSPWAISISRGGFEANFALFLALLGTTFFLYATKRLWFYLLSAICFGLTIHTYPTYKLVLPIFIVLLIWFQGGLLRLKEGRKWLLTAAVVFVLFGLLALTQTIGEKSEERFLSLNIFSEQETRSQLTQKIINDRNISSLPNFISNYIHNRPVEYIQIFFSNYFQNFSPEFLFFRGDKNPRHNMSVFGAFYIVELFFVISGILLLFRKGLNRTLFFLISWILLSPLATTFLLHTHFLRSAFMILPFLLLTAFGLANIWNFLSKVKVGFVLKCGLIILFLVQFVFLINNLFFLSPYKFSNFWSEPAKLAVMRALEQKDVFDYVIISTRIDNVEYAYPVYSKIDPVLIQQVNKEKSYIGDYTFKKFDNIYIGSIPDTLIESFIGKLNGRILYMGSRWEQPYLENYILVNGSDGQIAFIEKEKNN